MEILLLVIGKTDADYLKEGMEIYQKRLKNYVKLEVREVELTRKMQKKQKTELMKAESALAGKHIQDDDFLVLLDEYGPQMSSREFATYLQKRMNSGLKRLLFLVGGAYGFDDQLRKRANGQISVSAMTFPHQLVRLIFLEQLYRAFTILNNEPYHND